MPSMIAPASVVDVVMVAFAAFWIFAAICVLIGVVKGEIFDRRNWYI